MTEKILRCTIVSSTNGSVMKELLGNQFFKDNIYSVISDRNCLAIDRAGQHGIQTHIFCENDKEIFCARLLDYLIAHKIDYLISFYTKLFVGDLLNVYKDRIINLHPTLLPSIVSCQSTIIAAALANCVTSRAQLLVARLFLCQVSQHV